MAFWYSVFSANQLLKTFVFPYENHHVDAAEFAIQRVPLRGSENNRAKYSTIFCRQRIMVVLNSSSGWNYLTCFVENDTLRYQFETTNSVQPLIQQSTAGYEKTSIMERSIQSKKWLCQQ